MITEDTTKTELIEKLTPFICLNLVKDIDRPSILRKTLFKTRLGMSLTDTVPDDPTSFVEWLPEAWADFLLATYAGECTHTEGLFMKAMQHIWVNEPALAAKLGCPGHTRKAHPRPLESRFDFNVEVTSNIRGRCRYAATGIYEGILSVDFASLETELAEEDTDAIVEYLQRIVYEEYCELHANDSDYEYEEYDTNEEEIDRIDTDLSALADEMLAAYRETV